VAPGKDCIKLNPQKAQTLQSAAAISNSYCCRTYCLATMHSITDRRTDRQTDNTIMPIANRLKPD